MGRAKEIIVKVIPSKIANEFIKTINAKYNSNLPLHNPTYFPGISILPTN
jgi:ribosomal protein S17E